MADQKALFWSVTTLLAAWVAAPIHWSVAVFASIAGLMACFPFHDRLRAVVLALGVAPIWAAAAQEPHVGGVLVLLGALALIFKGGWLIPVVPWVVMAVGAVEGLRLAVLGEMGPGFAVVAVGVGAAGCMAGVRPSRGTVGCSVGVGLVLCVGALLSSGRLPTDAKAVNEVVRWGVVAKHRTHLVEHSDLGLVAISAAPTNHQLAVELVAKVGIEPVLLAGWRPRGDAVPPAMRIKLADWLEAQGRGGEALRILHQDPHGDHVAWYTALHTRLQRRVAAGEGMAPPPGVPSLPARISLDWVMVTNGERSLVFHANQKMVELEIETLGEARPSVLVGLDGESLVRFDVPEGAGQITLPADLDAGPHRLMVRFDSDAVDADGDRNLTIRAIVGR